MDNLAKLEEIRLLNKKTEYILKLVRHGVAFSEIEGLSLVELRDMVNQYKPVTITSVSCTPSGGTHRSIKIVTKKAA